MNEVLERVPRGPLLYVFVGIIGLLAVATLLGALLARTRPDKDFTELNARIRSWWFMAGVFMLAILLSRAVSLVFLAFLSFLALKEYRKVLTDLDAGNPECLRGMERLRRQGKGAPQGSN